LEIGRVLKDVPDDVIDEVVSDFESEGAKVIKERQADGKWTVRAILSEDE
jgi:hypothetical protein